MRRPVNSPYVITTQFGVRDSYALFGYHSGVDYAVPAGRPIYAPASGKVTNVVSNTGGNMVVLYDGQFYHRLMHNSSFSVPNGSFVSEGQEVAKCGSTGLSTGPHCHWDININGATARSFSDFRDPAKWLAGDYKVIGVNKIMDTDAKVKAQYFTLRGSEGTATERAGWLGKTYEQFNATAKAEAAARAKQLADLKIALANEQNKPPREIVKEVQVIVEKLVEIEKPVEVIKEVPTDPAWLKNVVAFIRKVLHID
jgi:hypothetical protein